LIFNFISFSWALPFFIFCNKKKRKKDFISFIYFLLCFKKHFIIFIFFIVWVWVLLFNHSYYISQGSKFCLPKYYLCSCKWMFILHK
jgi:hypothetical protein